MMMPILANSLLINPWMPTALPGMQHPLLGAQCAAIAGIGGNVTPAAAAGGMQLAQAEVVEPQQSAHLLSHAPLVSSEDKPTQQAAQRKPQDLASPTSLYIKGLPPHATQLTL